MEKIFRNKIQKKIMEGKFLAITFVISIIISLIIIYKVYNDN